MCLIEKLLEKFRGNTKGCDFNLCDWDIMSLFEHVYSGKPLTKSEVYAKSFLEDMGNVIERWHPTEKWKRPYGQVLNEHRTLH